MITFNHFTKIFPVFFVCVHVCVWETARTKWDQSIVDSDFSFLNYILNIFKYQWHFSITSIHIQQNIFQ